MANSPAYDIATFLASNSVGTTGTDIFVGREPAEGGLAITVYDSPAWRSPNPVYLRDYPSCQIRVRGDKNDYANTYTKAEEVKNVLLGATPQAINGEWYAMFTQAGDITFLGYDDLDHPILTTNWRLVRELSSGGNRLTF